MIASSEIPPNAAADSRRDSPAARADSAGQRNNWIDLLRGISAIAVVLFHFSVLPTYRPVGAGATAWYSLWSFGHLGVGVFFFLSGYCLIPGWDRGGGAIEFVRRRFWRILPPYWCSVLFILVLVVIFRLVNGVNDLTPVPQTFAGVVATVLLLTDPVTAVPSINWVYWTLSCIAAFYLLTGATLLAPRAHRAMALAGVHGLLCALDFAFNPPAAGATFFVPHWPVFAFGAALAVLPLHRRAGFAMLAVSALHALGTLIKGNDHANYVAVAVGLLLLVPLLGRIDFPRFLTPLATVGRFSYSLYLVHVPVGIYLLMRVLPDGFVSDLAYIGSQVAVLVAVLPAAYLFYRVAERPFLPRATTRP